MVETPPIAQHTWEGGEHVHHRNVGRRMLGTFTPSARARSVTYGLDEVEPARVGSFGALLSMPFEREGFLTQKSGLDPAHTDTIPV